MKIGEALQEKKRLQARLAKCYELMKESYTYKGDKPNFSFEKLQNEADNIIQKIKDLKIGIQNTNSKVKVKYEGSEHTLQELIIDIADIRSKLAQLNALDTSDENRWYFLKSEEHEIKYQVSPEDIQQQIQLLNIKKSTLDSLLQHINWTSQLIV